MLYASQLIGQPVLDPAGKTIARVQDIVLALPNAAERATGGAQPRLSGLIAGGRGREPGVWLPADHLGQLSPGPVLLETALEGHEAHLRGECELLVRKNMWDRRVIDTATHQVRRINDVVLGRADEYGAAPLAEGTYPAADLILVGADIGADGLIRRLGLYGLLARLFGRWLGPHILPWAQMELVAVGLLGDEVRHVDLNILHPVELARLTEGVSTREAAELIATLDDSLAADVLEELPAERQIDIVEFLPDTRAADILEEMAPDDASDLLGDLPDDRTSALLDQMDPDAVSAVRRLLRYPDNTAGGMMTTRFVSIPQHLTVEAVMRRLREAPEVARARIIYYIYVTEDESSDHLVGVITLRDLLLAAPDAVVADFMKRDLLFATPDDTQEEVARKMGEYNLLSLPVLQSHGRILGIVTVDDALDVLLPAGWQRHLPRVFS